MYNRIVRFTLTVPDDMARRAARLKKDVFSDKPYAEMYRQLILIGMEKLREERKENERF